MDCSGKSKKNSPHGSKLGKSRGNTTGSCRCLKNIYVDIKPATCGATSATASISYLCQQWVATSNVNQIKTQSTIIQVREPNQSLNFCQITHLPIPNPLLPGLQITEGNTARSDEPLGRLGPRLILLGAAGLGASTDTH